MSRRRTQWNSTLPAPTKRIARKVKLASVNPHQSAKRKKRTAQKRQSAHTREWRRRVLDRDGHQCTAIPVGAPNRCATRVFLTGDIGRARRCQAIEDLAVHHRTYAHIGREEMADGVTLCRAHHDYVEGVLRWYRRGRVS